MRGASRFLRYPNVDIHRIGKNTIVCHPPLYSMFMKLCPILIVYPIFTNGQDWFYHHLHLLAEYLLAGRNIWTLFRSKTIV